MVRVLICGESHMASEQHFKGFNHLFVASYSTFIHLLRTPLEERGHTVTWMAAHEVPNDFPFETNGLADFDVVLISDVGADSFLLHPDTWRHGLPRKNRLKMLREWVEAGHGLGMIGGWMTFAGYLGQARYAFSPLSSILPVKVLPYDDRMEIPEGAPPEPIAANHPILRGLEGKVWPDLMGYNLVDRGDEDAVDGRLEISALPIGRVAWQVGASHNRSPSREDRQAVPAPLAARHRVIARLPERPRQELGVRGFEFLKAHNVGLSFTEPVEQVRQGRLMLLILKLAIFIGQAEANAATLAEKGSRHRSRRRPAVRGSGLADRRPLRLTCSRCTGSFIRRWDLVAVELESGR